MLTARHPVDFASTRPELDALCRDAHAHDVEPGGHYDARSAAVNVWSHHWAHPATREESDMIGTFSVRWDTLTPWEIETEEGFSLEDLMQALGRWELAALGRVKRADVPEHP